ncbi:MAG: hypothetical protein JRH19_26480 [Deltaproteobacteria bacterium]|nr:hypothetical protein [Deltaproteobacteria bacterium]
MDFEDAVVVESFSSHELAEAAVSLLRSEGVEAVVSADDAGGELPNLDLAGGVRVLVPSASLDFARELLHSKRGG